MPAALVAAGEKKQITVLFADVAGSMDLQERLDAEVWAQIMGRFVQVLAEGVRKFGGTVDKFTGDGIMALFGAPVAQEDHARRACHAAWELTKRVGEYSEELRREQGVELQVRLGLNSGEVIVGRVGDDVTLDPTALGHTVGLAQRMEAMAEPGQTYLTQHTARLVEGWFGLDLVGTRPVKGVTHPLRIYALGRPRLTPARRTVGAVPLVGRERELSALHEALALAEHGQAQVVGVVGDAGVGKSRLCADFAGAVAARGITVRRAAGVSHGRDLPLLPMLAFQRDYFGITDADDEVAARRKVTERIVDLDPDLEAALPVMFDFLEIPDPTRPVPPMAPDVRMRRIFDVVRRVTVRRSEREILVLIFEDLHWFDRQSEAFLERLIESYPGSRTLVVTNFRPEFSARWMRHSYYRQVPLAPLGAGLVRDLLGRLLGSDPSTAPLKERLAERTGGNPFFLEEVIRDLVEKRTLDGQPGSYRLTQPVRNLEVPASVHAVLAARLDRVEAAPRKVLEAAAVIGSDISRSLIARVAALGDTDLDTALRALCSAELLYEAAPDPAEYRFWHPLTQEVAYGSLLTEQRADLHAAVARAIADDLGGRIDDRAAVIAFHYDRAADHRSAALWEDRSAHWASRHDAREAVRRWRAALAHVDADPSDSDAQAVGVQVRCQLVRVGARAGITEADTDRLFREARTMADDLGSALLLARLYQARGTERVLRGDIRTALDAYFEAHRLAIQAGDQAMQAAVSTGLSAVLGYVGPLDDALALIDEVAAVSGGDPDEGSQYLGFSPLVRSLLSRAEILAHTGALAEATRQAELTIELARQRQEAENLAWTLAVCPLIADLSGSPAKPSMAGAEEALRIAEDSGNLFVRVVALRAMALVALLQGDAETAQAIASDALGESTGRHLGLFEQGRLLVCLARSRLVLGDHDGALAAADEAVQATNTRGLRVFECAALHTRARIHRLGEPSVTSQAASDLAAALQLVHTTGALVYEPFIHEELGRLHHDEKRLGEALRLYRQIGATGHARRLDAELSGSVAAV